MSDFEAKLESARRWEKRISRWLRDRGYYIVPTYDFSGKDDDKAPKLLAPSESESLVLPDLQGFKPSDRLKWFEVKWKKRADVYRVKGYRVTGISRRLWKHYKAVQKITSGDVFVVFVHEEENEVRGDSLANLEAYVSHEYTGPKMGRDGMIFWQYDKIPRFGSLEILPIETAA